MFTSPTCVSLGTVARDAPERGFSRTRFVTVCLTAPSALEIPATGLPVAHPAAETDLYQPAATLHAVTPRCKRFPGGAGMLTCFPSTTPFGLALGAG